MKTFNLKNFTGKPLVLGGVIVTATCLSVLSAWSPPTEEGVDITTTGRVTANGPFVSNVSGGTANSVSNAPSVVVGSANNTDWSDAVSYQGKGIIAGVNNHISSISPLNTEYSAIIGGNNDVRGMNSIIVGSSNLISSTGGTLLNSSRNMAVFGASNTANPGSQTSLVSGYLNHVTATNSFVAGQGNTVEGPTAGSRTSVSAAIGSSNHIMAQNAWTMGASNEVTGMLSLGLGCGLVADSMGCTFVGEFNTAVEGSLTTRETEDPVFVVGNGIDSNNRSNAVVVSRDGHMDVQGVITCAPGGDIPMFSGD